MCDKCIHKNICIHKHNIDTDYYSYMGVKYDTAHCKNFLEEPDVNEFVNELVKRLSKTIFNSKYGKNFVYADTDSVIIKDVKKHLSTIANRCVKEVLSINISRIDMLINDLEECGCLELNSMTATEKEIVLDCLKLARIIKECNKIELTF